MVGLKATQRHRLLDFGLEFAITIGFLALCTSNLPLRWGFSFSRPALERFMAKANPPKEAYARQKMAQHVGLLNVLYICRDEVDNTLLCVYQNPGYSHYLVKHPRSGSYQLQHGSYLGNGWYLYSYTPRGRPRKAFPGNTSQNRSERV
jgi:hypothetical protein